VVSRTLVLELLYLASNLNDISVNVNVTGGVLDYGLAKKYLNAKEEFWKSNISPCKNMIFRNPSKQNQNPSRYYNSITNLKFQHKPKYHLSKKPHIKIDLLPRGQNPLSFIINLNTICLPL